MIQQNRTEKEKEKKEKKREMSHISKKKEKTCLKRERLRVDGIENGVLIQYKLSNRKSRSSAFHHREERVCVGVVGKKKKNA